MNIQPSILVVEDEEDIAELLRFGLQRAGFAVNWAKNLGEGQAWVKKVLPDVIVLDWMLPDGDGVTWLKALRADERSRHLPIIMLTARAQEQDKLQAIEFKKCILNDDDHTLSSGAVQETLGNTEFKLLKYLLTHQNKTYSRAQLLDLVWGDHVYIEERTVDVHVLRLRKILQKFELESYLETIRGVGYRWRSEV